MNILYFYWSKVSQHLTYFISIRQNLHKLVNQRTLGVLTDTLINKLTLRKSKYGKEKVVSITDISYHDL